MHKIIILTILIFICYTASSQTEQKEELNRQEYLLKRSIALPEIPFDVQTELFRKQPGSYSFPSFSELLDLKFNPDKITKRLQFSQNMVADNFYLLGNFQHYKNDLIYNVNDKLIVKIGTGLVKQNTSLSAFTPNYQISLYSSFEYMITDWLSAFLAGQFITPSISVGKTQFDPLLYMNPIFLNSDISTGLRAKHKNIKLDMGVSKMYDTQYKVANPIGSMNSKLIIGF